MPCGSHLPSTDGSGAPCKFISTIEEVVSALAMNALKQVGCSLSHYATQAASPTLGDGLYESL